LLWQSGGTGGAMTLFNTFRFAKSRPYGRPAILPVLANGGLKYPRSRGAWQIRLNTSKRTEKLPRRFFRYPLSMGKQRTRAVRLYIETRYHGPGLFSYKPGLFMWF